MQGVVRAEDSEATSMVMDSSVPSQPIELPPDIETQLQLCEHSIRDGTVNLYVLCSCAP